MTNITYVFVFIYYKHLVYTYNLIQISNTYFEYFSTHKVGI